MPTKEPLQRDQHQGDGQHRGPQNLDDAGGVDRPEKQRHAEPGHAGGAHLVDGDHEIQAGENGGEPGYEHSERCGEHIGVDVGGTQRRVERPARIHATPDDGVQAQDATHHVDVPTQQVQLGKSQVAGADHHGYQEISQHCGDGRNHEEEHHDNAVHTEELVVGARFEYGAIGLKQVDPNQHRRDASHQEEKGDRRHVENRDALVVRRQQPRLDAVIGVQIVHASIKIPCCYSHYFDAFPSCGLKDLMYAINCSNCSSVTCPLKVGMMGVYPSTIFAEG